MKFNKNIIADGLELTAIAMEFIEEESLKFIYILFSNL